MCLGKYTLQPASVRATHASECAQQAVIPSVGKAVKALSTDRNLSGLAPERFFLAEKIMLAFSDGIVYNAQEQKIFKLGTERSAKSLIG